MYLITFQHPSVWEEIQEKGLYICNHIGGHHEQHPISYGELATHVWVGIPIFAWMQVYKNKPLSLLQVERMLEMTSMPDNYLILELEVPDNIPLLTNFYDWSDLLFDEEEGFSGDRKTLWNNILDVNEQSVEIQVILPYLRKSWVKNVNKLKE